MRVLPGRTTWNRLLGFIGDRLLIPTYAEPVEATPTSLPNGLLRSSPSFAFQTNGARGCEIKSFAMSDPSWKFPEAVESLREGVDVVSTHAP